MGARTQGSIADAGSYEGWCRKEDVLVDWDRATEDLYNLIRGANPQPGAWTTFNGNEIKLFDSRIAEGEAAPGSVLAVDDEGVVVATADGAIRIIKLRADAGKIPAQDYAASAGLVVGSVLGS